MKAYMLKTAAFLFSMVVTNVVVAKPVNLNNVSITSITIDAESSDSQSASILIKVLSLTGTSDPNDCDGQSTLKLLNSAYYFSEVYSLLLTAKFNDKNVNFVIEGDAASGCEIIQVELNNL